MNHSRVPVFIPGYNKSYALFSEEYATTAVVFVHGFGGNAVDRPRAHGEIFMV
jgi:hypothetical protein